MDMIIKKNKILFSYVILLAFNFLLHVRELYIGANYHPHDDKNLEKINQLTKEQVQKIKKLNEGSPIYCEHLEVKNGIPFLKELDIRENDVFLITITRLYVLFLNNL